MVTRVNDYERPRGNPDTPIPEGLLYTREQLQDGMRSWFRPVIPTWHMVDGVIKLTYWHAVKYYAPVLCVAEAGRSKCSMEEAKEFVSGYIHFRNKKIEDVLKWLLDVFPPLVGDEAPPATHRSWELVRNRTSECPQPPLSEQVAIKPYVIQDSQNLAMRFCMGLIFEGEPDKFFKYIREVREEAMAGLTEIGEAMNSGSGKDARRYEPLYNMAKMMVTDITLFLERSQ